MEVFISLTPKFDSPNGEGWVIGVGASAGGLEALSLFVSNLPAHFAASIIIAQHLAPHAKSMMVELLQRQSALPVISASDGEVIRPRTVYVAPPNHDIDIVDDRIQLSLAGNETRPKPSVDSFFESLARAYGNHSVGVILSGTGTDGSEGIQAIKSVGGITLAQDNRSAKYDGMPKSAVSTGNVDSILSPDQMAKELLQLLRDHDNRIKYDKIDGRGLKRILTLIKEERGTDFRQYKMSTIQRRTVKRMVSIGVESFDDYFDVLKNTPGELGQLAQEMLVSVTSFFRDPEVFEGLEPILAKLVGQKGQNDELRVWVAGCATGEEAYTIAMLLLDAIERSKRFIPIKIFASDLDHDAILEARHGFYTEKECEKIPQTYLEKYFERREEGYQATKRLREIVVFARQDLTQNPPFVKVDLISCRNVLIYFEPELQKKVIDIFHYALNPSGILVLGKSESVSNISGQFEVVNRQTKIFHKLNIPSRPLPTVRPSAVSAVIKGRDRMPTGPSLAETSYLRLLKTHNICGVTIDESCNIVQIIGDVSPYLGFFTPHVDFRLTNLLPKGVGAEIPALIRKAKRGEIQKSRAYKIKTGTKQESFHILIRSLSEDPEEIQSTPLFVVSFEKRNQREKTIPSTNSENDLPMRVGELEQELFVTREHLQTVIEELGVSNEELQSLNEELSSTNEELQASSEELETTNEELQSSNEELTTVNEELNAKQHDLKVLNASLESVESSIGSPLLIVDSQKKVLRYNSESLKVFGIGPSDLGRELSRISSHFEAPNFEGLIDDAIQKGKTNEVYVKTGTNTYLLRVLPCFDEQKSITGAILVFFDSTHTVEAQKKLAESEHLLRAINDGSPSIVSLKDSLGRYLMINEAFRKFFGLEDKEVIGKTDREIFPDKIAVPLRESDLEVFVHRKPCKNKQLKLEVNGHRFYFLISCFPIMDGSGHGPFAVGTVATDITAQVKAQRELHRSESRYKAIVEDQAVFVCRHDAKGKINYVNASFASQFGGTVENNLGKDFLKLVAEPDRPRVETELRSISPNHPIVQYEHRTCGPNASRTWVRWIHRGIFDSSGAISEYQAVGFDVTESRQKTEQLLESDTIYSSVFHHTVDFLSVYRVRNGEFIFESFNRSVSKALGNAHAQLVGRNLKEFIDPEKLDEVLERYQRCLQTKQTEVFDEKLELPAGSKYFSTTLVPIPNLDGRIERIAAISRDVSSYKRDELQLRLAKEEADIANKSKSDFLASMSHELRTPLNVVIGMSQLLSDFDLTPEQNSMVGSIFRSGKVLLALIEDVLDVSKIEAGKVKLEAVRFNPAELAKDVLELFALQAKGKKVQLISDITKNVDQFVIGDPARLRQILVNLISNALKFTEEGAVTLSVSAEVDHKIQESFLQFSVKDTGIGIPKAYHKRLFQRFSQVDSGSARKYGGTGLGLTISKQLIHLMDGEIGFDSSEGKGSNFWFNVTLPLSTHVPIAAPKKQDSRHLVKSNGNGRTPIKKLKVLAVDDSPDNLELIDLLLKHLGHECSLAKDGYEAVEQIRKGEFDLILMDIQMPEMDGYETTDQIRGLEDSKAKVPIVALTANAMAGDAERAFNSKMDDYLTKPIQLDALTSMLNKWAERGSDEYQSPN